MLDEITNVERRNEKLKVWELIPLDLQYSPVRNYFLEKSRRNKGRVSTAGSGRGVVVGGSSRGAGGRNKVRRNTESESLIKTRNLAGGSLSAPPDRHGCNPFEQTSARPLGPVIYYSQLRLMESYYIGAIISRQLELGINVWTFILWGDDAIRIATARLLWPPPTKTYTQAGKRAGYDAKHTTNNRLWVYEPSRSNLILQ